MALTIPSKARYLLQSIISVSQQSFRRSIKSSTSCSLPIASAELNTCGEILRVIIINTKIIRKLKSLKVFRLNVGELF
jgi:hypothetical protein